MYFILSDIILVLKWNAEGAFIGRFARMYGPPGEPTPGTSPQKKLNGPFPFAYFLAVPFLTLDDRDNLQVRFNQRRKFTQWPHTQLAAAINAFEHFAFIKRNRKLIFTDLQGEFLRID